MMINELLNIKYPIFQGAMANIATPQFAACVSNSGGLGIIATGAMDATTTREAIRTCKALTNKPFGVNVMLMNPDTENIMKVICQRVDLQQNLQQLAVDQKFRFLRFH